MPIICATDFSACSRTAVDVAAGLARRSHQGIVLVHVVAPPPPTLAAGLPLIHVWEDEERALRLAELEVEAERVRAFGVQVDARLERGSPWRLVVEMAASAGASALVVGRHGRGALDRLMLGSCAERIARSAVCPVLVVPERAAALDRWNSRAPLRVALVADGSPAARALYFWARTTPFLAAPELTILRSYWPPQEAARYGLDHPWQGEQPSPELVPLLERAVQRDAAALFGARAPDIRLRPMARDAAREIADELPALGVDAVAIGVARHRVRQWTPVDPKALLQASAVPVFCVPEEVRPAETHLPRYRTVLIASDLSALSRDAILPAYGLLTAGGRVVLCYVHPLAEPPLVGHAEVDLALSDGQRAELEEQLRAQVAPEAAEHGIATQVSVLEGPSIATAILQAAERADADAIALASHGRTGLGRLLLGSVAEEVARRSSRPLLIVHAKPGDGRA